MHMFLVMFENVEIVWMAFPSGRIEDIIDDQSQWSFATLKKYLMSALILGPPNYGQYFILCLITSNLNLIIDLF